MIILIPLGGTGNRFKLKNIKTPKALIKVNNKEIIFYLLDNLVLNEKISFIYIPYNKEYSEFDFENKITNRYSNIKFKFFCLEKDTDGAAETINISINNLIKNEKINDQPVLCLDSDNFYHSDIIKYWDGENVIFTFKNELMNNKFSYITCNDNNKILNIVEKEPISKSACTGGYGFNSIFNLNNYCEKVIKNNIRQKNEFYTSCAIKEMLNDKIEFKNIEIKNKDYFSLGTPEQVDEFMKPYIFDLDGTLVNTDHIYTKVWNEIISKYNLVVDEEFFSFFIQGKNDLSFLKDMFPNITSEQVNEISNLKDELFIEILKKNDDDIMIKGAFKFISSNVNKKMCIVTSCNKKSAEYIVEKTGIKDYMQFVIASEDCVNHKPNKEPYDKAINKLNALKENCTIFEDSISGYKSAKSCNVGNICLIINEKSNEEVKNLNEFKIKNYDDYKYDLINNKTLNNIKELIINELSKKKIIIDVIFDENELKTGYICDIKSLKVLYKNNTEKIVLKIQNIDNELSKVAKKINLYTNEEYFYKVIQKSVNTSSPKYFGSIDDNDKIGILLENINIFNGQFNLDLNKDIDLILKIVNDISEMHNNFTFSKKTEVLNDFKLLNKVNEITYYKELIQKRFNKFMKINNFVFTEKSKKIITKIHDNFDKIINKSSEFPLNFCHGDLKSANIFYKKELNNYSPIYLDWQYIHLNKGISDIAFLLVESTDFNNITTDIVLKYYFKKSKMYSDYSNLLFDFKLSLCIFPYFVMLWFNSENREKLIDKVFPIRFMKNLLKFYEEYITDDFFNF
jgi:HAD superfamily hydrolase (TIGR01549 family)